jgi:hypothetical protein
MLYENASVLKFYMQSIAGLYWSIEDLGCDKIPSENHAICNDTNDVIDFPC